MDFRNIAKLTNQSNNYEVQNDNFRLLEQMNKEGISLRDTLNDIADLKKRMAEAESKKPQIDEDLFQVMEASGRDVDSVKSAKNRVTIEKNRVIADLCMKDEGFRKAYDDYKRVVNQAYIEKKEGQGESERTIVDQ